MTITAEAPGKRTTPTSPFSHRGCLQPTRKLVVNHGNAIAVIRISPMAAATGKEHTGRLLIRFRA
uniref:Uncharacterized protein n=1 Tax=Aegilops tauschii TaxID=37682 RepID=M8CFR7_AEGTA